MDTLTIAYSDWSALTSRVALFAATDGTPVLASVRIFERGGRLMAEASNRYILAWSAASPDVVPPDGFSVLLSTSTLTQLGRALGVTAKTAALTTLTLTPSDYGQTVTITATGGLALGDMTMTVPQVEGTYPSLARIAENARTHDVAPAPAFSPWLLALIAKALPPRAVVRMEQHGMNPAFFESGDETLAGLITPARAGEESHVLLDLYAPVTELTEAVA